MNIFAPISSLVRMCAHKEISFWPYREGWKDIAYVSPYSPGTRQRKRRRDERRGR